MNKFTADVLTVWMVLRPKDVSRNKHFLLWASAEGRVARVRAVRVRSLLGQLTGEFGRPGRVDVHPHPHPPPAVEPEGRWTLRFELASVALTRSVVLDSLELSLLRVALQRRGIRLLPSALAPQPHDVARIDDLLTAPLPQLAARRPTS